VKGVKAPAEADRFTLTERNLALYDGVGTTRVAAGGEVQLERIVTTYQANAAGAADTSYLDVTTMLTLLYLRYSFRNRILVRYPRHKLANDGTRFGAGQAVITPKIGKAEAVGWFREMEELGLVEGFEQFKNDLVVERNASDPNRLDFLLPPDLINAFVIGAASLQFRL
jgi:phage tail sheath gpL-like